MKPKLYTVTLTTQFVMQHENLESDWRAVYEITQNEYLLRAELIDSVKILTIKEIKSLEDLPEDYTGGSLPWGYNGNKTIGAILKEDKDA